MLLLSVCLIRTRDVVLSIELGVVGEEAEKEDMIDKLYRCIRETIGSSLWLMRVECCCLSNGDSDDAELGEDGQLGGKRRRR